jgi:hypothetical protein
LDASLIEITSFSTWPPRSSRRGSA